MLSKALVLADDHGSEAAQRARLDQLRARTRDYLAVAVERSMGAERQISRNFVHKLVESVSDPTATQYADEIDLPVVDIDRPDLIRPLVLTGAEANMAFGGLQLFAREGDECDKRQVELFLDDFRLDTPATAPRY